MNQVVLIGRLTKDPEVKVITGNDTTVARFTVAVDRFSKDKGADFVPIVVFGRQAENCERYLKKGSQVAVNGRIQTGSYEKQDGTKVYTTDVIANNVEFLGKAEGTAEPRKEEPKEDAPDGFAALKDDDIPF